MSTFVSHYPGGSGGLALLILRWSLTVELWFLAYILRVSIADWEAWVAIALALALLVGFGTQIAALIYAGVAVFAFKVVGGVVGASVALTGLMAISLALLGPGTFSLDARLYGRREISLDNELGNFSKWLSETTFVGPSQSVPLCMIIV
jgi:hypothetical protein